MEVGAVIEHPEQSIGAQTREGLSVELAIVPVGDPLAVAIHPVQRKIGALGESARSSLESN
jgi:hypothetical protein